jgi:hypothetical protein
MVGKGPPLLQFWRVVLVASWLAQFLEMRKIRCWVWHRDITFTSAQ